MRELDRPDQGDVLLLMGFLWRVAPNEHSIARGRRVIELVFQGIGAQ